MNTNAMCYWEIPSRNVARSSAFYAKLFNWRMTPSGKDYMMFAVKGGLGGGIYQAKEAPGKGVLVYIKVKDIPAVLRRVVKLGGKVIKPKTEIGGDWGYWAQFRDPGGCTSIMLWSKT